MTGSGWRRLTPLVLATMASQAMIVVLAPTIVAISSELGASVPSIGQARSVTAVVAVVASVVLTTRTRPLSTRTGLVSGARLAVVASALVATSVSVPVFLVAHVLVGVAQALLLTTGFAGVTAFTGAQRGWATGYVSAAQALAWVVVNPVAAMLTEQATWRLAHLVPATIAAAALVTARLASPLPAPAAGGGHWAPLRVRSARRWIAAEAAGFAAWTAVLTFAGAFFIEYTGAGVAATGWILALGAFGYFAAASFSGSLTSRFPKDRLVAVVALVMAGLFPVMLSTGLPTAGAAAAFGVVGVVAGIRTPASTGLALEQLPGQPTAMMAARTAAIQLGYLIGAVLGGVVIAGWGYPALGLVLGLVMVLSALLFLRVCAPADRAPSA